VVSREIHHRVMYTAASCAFIRFLSRDTVTPLFRPACRVRTSRQSRFPPFLHSPMPMEGGIHLGGIESLLQGLLCSMALAFAPYRPGSYMPVLNLMYPYPASTATPRTISAMSSALRLVSMTQPLHLYPKAKPAPAKIAAIGTGTCTPVVCVHEILCADVRRIFEPAFCPVGTLLCAEVGT
jgi:hypothetical protein